LVPEPHDGLRRRTSVGDQEGGSDVSRRAFVFGGAGLAAALTGGALVEEDVLPGKVRLDRAIGRCRTLPAPAATPGVVQTRTFRSRFRGTDTRAPGRAGSR
jgi:hypothetical protein